MTILAWIAAAVPVVLAIYKLVQAIWGGGSPIEKEIVDEPTPAKLRPSESDVLADLGLRSKPSTDDQGRSGNSPTGAPTTGDREH